MKNKKENSEKKDIIKIKEKEKLSNKIKKNYLVDTSKTLILILVIILILFGINILVINMDLLPLDFTQEGLYSLSDESKDRIKTIEKEVNIYFIGYDESYAILDLVKQYGNINEKINVEVVTSTSRPDLVQKYAIEDGTQGIIVESGEKFKVLTEYDLYTYDYTTGQSINIAEEVFTSSIVSVVTEDVPNVYFLDGYSEMTLDQNLYLLGVYLSNEIVEVNTVNTLSEGSIPEDCDVLVITTPNKDFEDITVTAIENYINLGGNILWMNSAVVYEEQQYENVDKVLAMYGIDPFDIGLIRETDSSNMVSGSPDIIFPTINYSEVTKNTPEVIFVNATKININEEKMTELSVVKSDILTTSESAYFRTNIEISDDNAVDGEETGMFTVAAEMTKTITEENTEEGISGVESKLIIFGEQYFVSDLTIMQNSQYPAIQLSYNKNIILDSIAYLGEREEDIEARKSTGTVTIYSPSETQDTIIKIIIFAMPVLIIVIGIVVWQVRRRKK